ncbi:MAG: IS21 family transposase [Deltaproteobacteria bacterium]|nr:IS21 family transposase [Deltaproteobacteria bacterium]
MINKRTIFEIHRLKDMRFSVRQIAKTLNLDRSTIAKYIKYPDVTKRPRQGRSSKLDPFRGLIKDMVEQYSKVNAPVVLRKIQDKGFDGEITIVRQYLRHLRCNLKQAFIRFESQPGQQMQIDWGHFGSLLYENSSRKLYALAVIESHSRMLYVIFTHSQNQATLHQSLVKAFKYFGGTPKEIVVDNMLTAVTERVGSMVRFNESFLNFLRPFSITPVACNVRAPYEKGKVESSIKYLRYNFWPLKTFIDLEDVNHQVLSWLNTANQRMHQTTGEKPVHRFVKDALRSLPEPLPDFRETQTLKVYKDFGIRFDTNVYTVPPRLVGKSVTLKADSRKLSVYYKEKQVATHVRTWKKKDRIDLPSHSEQVKKLKKKVFMDKQIRVFMSLGQEAVDFLEKLADASQPLKKTVDRLLALSDDYGTASIIYALRKALKHKLYGFAYVQNILYQEMSPATQNQPVTLKDNELNEIRLAKPNLAEYDAIAIQRRKK